MGEHGDRMLWEALLLQARANLTQAEANLSQARANEETSHVLHNQTQCMVCREDAVDLEPDRLESRYAAKCDAEAGAAIAVQVAQQAEGIRQDV